jgi:hypothetical protein
VGVYDERAKECRPSVSVSTKEVGAARESVTRSARECVHIRLGR